MDDTYPMLIRLGFLPSLLQCPHKSQCHSSSNWLLLSPLVGTVTHNEREAPTLPVFKRGKKKNKQLTALIITVELLVSV